MFINLFLRRTCLKEELKRAACLKKLYKSKACITIGEKILMPISIKKLGQTKKGSI